MTSIHAPMLPVREHGPKDATPVLLLLHFFGGSHREWDGVVGILQEKHHIVTADMAGFGEAAALEGYSVAEMVTRVKELIDILAPAPVLLVGHSMSGKAAMIVAADPPVNLAGTVLVAPSPLAGEPMSDKARAAMRIANTSRDRAESFLQKGFTTKPSEAALEIAVEDVLRANTDAFHAWADHGTREDWSGRVKAFAVKTLLVVGEEDRAINPAIQQEQTFPLAVASGGRLHLLPKTGHLIPYEQPDNLATLLHDFAREVA